MSKIKSKISNTNPTIEQAVEMFMRRCKIKNLSNGTIKAYGEKLEVFRKYLHDDFLLTDLSSDTVDGFILWLRENTDNNDVSINSYLRHVRAFIYYLQENGYVNDFKIHLIKADKPIKETYTDAELEILLKKPDFKKASFGEIRTWAFINFLCGSGQRLRTCINVKIQDVDFANFTITLRQQKNRIQAIIPLSKTLADVLIKWLDIRGGNPDDFLFCTEYGEQLTDKGVQTAVYRYNHNHGVDKTSIHAFRHSFAKSWVMSGGDIFRLQKILGHSTLEVTKGYVNLFGQDLQQNYEQFNPLDRLTKQRIIVKKGR